MGGQQETYVLRVLVGLRPPTRYRNLVSFVDYYLRQHDIVFDGGDTCPVCGRKVDLVRHLYASNGICSQTVRHLVYEATRIYKKARNMVEPGGRKYRYYCRICRYSARNLLDVVIHVYEEHLKGKNAWL